MLDGRWQMADGRWQKVRARTSLGPARRTAAHTQPLRAEGRRPHYTILPERPPAIVSRPSAVPLLLLSCAAIAMAACAHPRPAVAPAPAAPITAVDSTPPTAWCDACFTVPFDSAVMNAVVLRV